ncbi:hypothetical protein GALMADRAFT_145312 [Galerina marginata CBS 339.88]|uniref:AB hydrolase-1 domain-containing protein n=1 Tax=Galerina marginata (strain CBS 339.88) TaxID=685588 RepID=A0A067SF54_GALM3|nr:hypothetical protein GALMADRAFT_145312 [Galerina marginata CBS 339.88]
MSTSTKMTIDHFVLDTNSTGGVLKATANRYRPGSKNRQHQEPGYILLFAHGTGFHKELWEPTIERLFEDDNRNDGVSRVLEAWAIDCQNHGEAAPLNDEILLNKPGIITIYHYADAFAALYRSGLLGKLDRSIHKVALLGHSAGAIASVLTTTLFGPPNAVPFEMVILIEPPMFSPEMANNMTEMYRIVEKTTSSRRSMWNSKEEAYMWLKKRSPWKFWDPRILKLHVEHGLRQLPSPFNPDQNGVALICRPTNEAAAFSGTSATHKAVEHLNIISSVIPIHLVFGARNDMFSREVQDSIHDPSVGRVIKSVKRVEGAGHLIVQEKPGPLADTLYSILTNSLRRSQDNYHKL